MTTTQYLVALKTLGLTRASKKTAAALGVTVRQCQRYADGENIPETIALLLECYVKRGYVWVVDRIYGLRSGGTA